MVESQIRNRGITDSRVLAAMTRVPRDLFIPQPEQVSSYYDGPLPIGFGQTISQPYIVAYMTELLELTGAETVLEIGTGSGYQTAILAEVIRQVYTVEIVSQLHQRAQGLLTDELGYTNIKFKCENGRKGWPGYAPYDRILVTAAPDELPSGLFDQLKEGGVAIAPIGGYFQKMIKYRKVEGKIENESLIGVSFVPLV